MNKSFLISALLLVLCISCYSQTGNIEYFEANASASVGPDETPPDSISQTLAFAVSINNFQGSDSLYLKLTDSNGQLAYSGGNTLSGWQATQANRIEGNILYLTIEGGQYPWLNTYVAEAVLKTNGTEILRTYNKY